jgi:diguanylate cyclase (GGDEF)-like protein
VEKANILIVDDVPENLVAMEAILESPDVNIIKASSGNEALACLLENEITIVLLDVQMPEMNGFETAELMRTRKATRQIPIIFVTAINKEQKYVFEGYALGAVDYMFKPIDPDILKCKINVFIELEHARRMERYRANHDVLTNLPNRQMFRDICNKSLAAARRSKQSVSIMFLDLNRFKIVNDTLGHDVGDLLLQEVSERLASCVRDSDTVARMGGDEFIILLQNFRHAEDLARVAGKIHEKLDPPYILKGHELYMSSSIGISIYPADGSDYQSLMKNADTAMYHAKRDGKNNFYYYDRKMNVDAEDRLLLENNLRKALGKDEFLLHYQPQVDMKTGKIIGAEALARWTHPDLGHINPAKFIPIAEDSGQIVPIGEWVLRTACMQKKAWIDAGFSPVLLAVNFSARQFKEQNLLKLISNVLKETGLDASYLELELTEGSTMDDVEYSIEIMSALRELGVRISIDDFGTGFSSLNYLKKFPINTLKIDQSFVRDIGVNFDGEAITRAIIAMAHNMNVNVIAEGVETKEQLDFLCDHGCDVAQGYLFSHPVSAEAFTELLNKGRSLLSLEIDKTSQDRRKRL